MAHISFYNCHQSVQLLDLVADYQRNQLSPWEISLLGLSVVAAALSPVLFPDTPRLVEVMAPATAACKFQQSTDDSIVCHFHCTSITRNQKLTMYFFPLLVF